MFGLSKFLGFSGVEGSSTNSELVPNSEPDPVDDKGNNKSATTPKTKQKAKAVELLTRTDTTDGSIDSFYSVPLIVISLTGEMINILKERLKSQNVGVSRAETVLDDVLAAGFAVDFIHELFRPQGLYNRADIRNLFDRLAHASIMRLNKTSMDKLFDLMVMAVKRQFLLSKEPNQILQVTLIHLEELLLRAKKENVKRLICQTIENTLRVYGSLSCAQWLRLYSGIMTFFQEERIKVSTFLQKNVQLQNGILKLQNTGAMPYGAELPGEVRYFKGGNLTETLLFESKLRTESRVVHTVLDPTCILGSDYFVFDVDFTGTDPTRDMGQLPDSLVEAAALIQEAVNRGKRGQAALSWTARRADKGLLAHAIQCGSKPWRRSKLSLLGQGRAGKTAFANAIAGRDFEETASTVGINQLTCDVKQVKTGSSDSAEAQQQVWGECTGQGGREYETALAHMIVTHRREQEAEKAVEKKALQKHIASSGNIVSYMQSVMGAAVTTACDSILPGGDTHQEQESSTVAQSRIDEQPVERMDSPDSDVEAEVGVVSVPKTTSTELEPSSSTSITAALPSSNTAEVVAATSPHSVAVSASPNAGIAETASAALDEELVMKMLATMQDADTGLLISLFDFGGQSVFDVIHHLFLTRNGVYALVFNMEWLVKEGPEKDKALRFMRNWLSSIAVHTFNKTTKMTAPIVIVGTRLDTITSAADHEKISTILHEQFSDNIAWRSVVGNEEGRDRNGRAFQWFFPVDNKLGKRGASMQLLMSVVHAAIDVADYTHKEVPLSWFRVIDAMADTKKDCLTLPDVTALAARCQVAEAEVPYLLAFLHDMGHLMWLDEPGLRDVVVLDPVSYLVTPATIIICKLTPDHDDTTHHFMASHRECERLHKREWTLLKRDGILNPVLLSILWKEYAAHRDVLLQLMVKFGLLVPLRTAVKSKGSATVMQYLVPTLLSPAGLDSPSVLQWTDRSCASCYLVFTLVEELSENTVLMPADLQSSGFLPGGMFERIVGKALSWSQDTAKGSGVNLQSVLLHKDMAVMAFGGQRFRLVNCADIHCVRVDIEGSNPLGIQQKLQDFVARIIEECMPSLHCFPALLYSSSARDSSAEQADPLQKTLLASELLIPLQQLRAASQGESMLAWRGGRRLMSTADIKAKYASWLRLHELRERYDVFISYRWGQYDSDFTEAVFDMFTNYSVGVQLRGVEVFLDRKRLQDGRMFKRDFASALCNSVLALPVVSVDALRRMVDHQPAMTDNVLLEWVIMLESYKAGRVLKVFPVLFGTRTAELILQLCQSSSTGAETSGTAAVPGLVVGNFFSENIKDLLPRIAPTATLAQALELLKVNNITPSDAMSGYTVHSIVHELLQFLLCKASDFPSNEVVEQVAEKVVRLLQDCDSETLDAVVAVTVPAAGTSGDATVGAGQPAAEPLPSAAIAPPVRCLKDLSVTDVQGLLAQSGFTKLQAVFLSNEVAGKQLWFCEEYTELLEEDFGLTSKPQARALMEQILQWKQDGVTVI